MTPVSIEASPTEGAYLCRWAEERWGGRGGRGGERRLSDGKIRDAP